SLAGIFMFPPSLLPVFLPVFQLLTDSLFPNARKSSSGNGSPSPDRSGNPFWGGVRPKKIAADSGKWLLIFIKSQIFKNSKFQSWRLQLRSARHLFLNIMVCVNSAA
ncbi:hypothetical protein ACWA1F_23240, partial [Flavobacterium sp. 3-218]